MTLSCAEVLSRFEDYSAEALPIDERRAVREHLGACASCRREAVAGDPLFLFAGSGSVSPDEGIRVLEAVRTGIALRQTERRLEVPARRRRWSALASAAAALALTLLAPGTLPRREGPGVSPAPREAIRADLVPAAGPGPAEEAFQKTGRVRKFPADATIYDWSPGAGQPRVVWIVDRSIDI